jgi:hypothetical protein
MILKNYVTIQGWQVSELKLSGNELIAYALIYGFCQAKNKTKLSLGYISEWLGTTKRATIKILKHLFAHEGCEGPRIAIFRTYWPLFLLFRKDFTIPCNSSSRNRPF